MGSFGGFEWLIVILVVLLLFGAKRIPELARGLGQGINEFRKASDEIKKEIDQGAKGSGGSNYNSGNNSNSGTQQDSQPSGSQQESAETESATEQTENSAKKETKN
jgi:sec-independent protein translocase protein TatA